MIALAGLKIAERKAVWGGMMSVGKQRGLTTGCGVLLALIRQLTAKSKQRIFLATPPSHLSTLQQCHSQLTQRVCQDPYGALCTRCDWTASPQSVSDRNSELLENWLTSSWSDRDKIR